MFTNMPDLYQIMFSRNFLIIYGVILVFSIIRAYAVGSHYSSGQDRLDDKTVIITGGISGIGKASAIKLANLGARVIIAARNISARGEEISAITDKCPAESIKFMELDVSSFKSVLDFVKAFKEGEDGFDVLVNNSGIMCHPEENSVDGNELHMATNFLGPVLLTRSLMGSLRPRGRVINLVSSAMSVVSVNPRDLENSAEEYNPGTAFARSKLFLALYSRFLSEEVEAEDFTVNCLHPGVVLTGIHRYLTFRQNSFIRISSYPLCWLLMKYPFHAAEAVAMMAASPDFEGKTGIYISGCNKDDFPSEALDDEARDAVCEYAHKILDDYLVPL